MRLRCVSNYIRRLTMRIRASAPKLKSGFRVRYLFVLALFVFFNEIKCHNDVMNCGGRGAGTTLEGVGPALCPGIDPSLFIGGAVRPSCVLGFSVFRKTFNWSF